MKISNKERVFPFSNENITAISNLYDFTGAEVFSVVGSGDQYFAGLLKGAKKIELYDVKRSSYDYFLLKYYSILILSYEEFCEFFIIGRATNRSIFQKVIRYLPEPTKSKMESLWDNDNGLRDMFYPSRIYMDFKEFQDGEKIPYLKKETYYRLQALLRNAKIPVFHLYSLTDLPKILKGIGYDLILTSNIFQWLNISLEEYKNLLNKLNCPVVQADYIWHQRIKTSPEYSDKDFSVDEVPCFFRGNQKDRVITFRKK